MDLFSVFGVWIKIEMRIVLHRYDTNIYMQFQRNDKEIFGSSLQKLSAQKNTFQWTDERNCVYFSPQNLLFCADKSILRAVIWLVLLMHASYSNHIVYNETPTLTVLNGPPSWVVRSTSKNGRSEARYRQWTRCSEMTLQDLTVLASSRNTKINKTSLVFHGLARCRTWTLSKTSGTSSADVFLNREPAVSKPLWILQGSTAWVGQDFMSLTHVPNEFKDENVPSCYSAVWINNINRK